MPPINLLPPGSELGKEVFAFLASNVRDCLAVRLHDLETVVVHSDAPLEVALVLFDGFRSDIEDVAMQLIFLLLADVEDVVFGNFVARQDKRQAVANIGEIFLGDGNPTVFERRLGSEYNVLKTPSLIIKDHVENFLVFSGNRVPVQSLHLDFLPIGVLVASLFKLLFFRGEALDDLLWRAALGLRRIKRSLLGDSVEGQKPR